MREITVDFLDAEAARLRAVLAQKPVFHPSGVRLHSPGEAITPETVKLMRQFGMKSLYILEPGETEFKALGALDVERIAPRALAAGDVLAEDLWGLDGAMVASAGQVLDAAALARAKGARGASTAIRRRGMEAAQKQARDYLARRPPAPARGARTDERVTEFIRAALIQVRPLLVPAGRIAVGVREEFSRAVVHNALAGAGYEPIGWDASPTGLEDLRSRSPDLVVIDLEDALSLCLAIRKEDGLRGAGILVCAEDGRKAEIASVLLDGANDSVHRPPPPDLLLYKVRVCMQAMGRAVNLKPAILMDRRGGPRGAAKQAGTLRDAASSGPLPVSAVAVTDLGEGGARIEYARPDWPARHAFLPHGVHPRHFFHEFAKSNARGQDLVLAFSPPAGGRNGPPGSSTCRSRGTARPRGWPSSAGPRTGPRNDGMTRWPPGSAAGSIS